MHADRLRRLVQCLVGAEMQIDVGQESLRIAADDGKHQGEVVMCSADYGLRTATDPDPCLEWAVLDRRKDVLVDQRWAQLPLPGDGLLLQERGEQLELLVEQLFILVERKAEKAKGFGERASSKDNLGTSIRSCVECGEAFKNANGIVRTQDGGGRTEPDSFGAGCDRRQHDLGCRHDEIPAMMFADSDEVDAHFVGQ